MAERGTLDSLQSQIREDKIIRLLLDKAKTGGADAGPKAPAAEGESKDVETT